MRARELSARTASGTSRVTRAIGVGMTVMVLPPTSCTVPYTDEVTARAPDPDVPRAVGRAGAPGPGGRRSGRRPGGGAGQGPRRHQGGVLRGLRRPGRAARGDARHLG